MRLFLGMILGAALTVAAAYVSDNWRSDATAGTADNRAMVNWTVVEDNWRVVRQQAHDAWAKLSQKVAS